MVRETIYIELQLLFERINDELAAIDYYCYDSDNGNEYGASELSFRYGFVENWPYLPKPKKPDLVIMYTDDLISGISYCRLPQHRNKITKILANIDITEKLKEVLYNIEISEPLKEILRTLQTRPQE